MTSKEWKPSSRLLLGYPEDRKESLTERYKYSKELIERIIDLLSKDLSKLLEDSDGVEKFQSPNWGLLQAHAAGQREALRSVLHLIKPKE